jgi:ferredoxin
MARLNRRHFLRAASGLFVPAILLRSRADMVFPGPIMRTVGAPYVASNADFDGSADSMRLTSSGPTGLADSKLFTFSCWVRFDGGDGVAQALWTWANSLGTTRCQLFKQATNTLRVFARNSAGSTILDLTTTNTWTASANWLHVYVCIDTASSANCKIYVDGGLESHSGSPTDDTISWVSTSARYTIGGDGGAPGALLNGALAELWWNDSYLDDTTKFASGGCPISLGSDGSTPTGSAPVFYLKGSGNGFNVNSGTGGNFTVTGSLGTTTGPC